jgi:hypothetical protein
MVGTDQQRIWKVIFSYYLKNLSLSSASSSFLVQDKKNKSVNVVITKKSFFMTLKFKSKSYTSY